MIAYRADNWLIFQADKRNDNRVTLPSAKKIVTFLKIPAFKDSSFWRFPLLEIPRFKDSRFLRFSVLEIPAFKDSPF